MIYLLLLNTSSRSKNDKKYKVTLKKDERDDLTQITRKRSHKSQRVINASILLNGDVGAFQVCRMRNEDVAVVLNISMRKGKRVYSRKKGRRGFRGTSGRAQLLPAARRFFEVVFLRLLADRVVELADIDSVSYETVRRVKKRNQALEKAGMGYSPRAKGGLYRCHG